mmetsp:Transcript_58930/g.175287  ORF Transcript_58930/g.175287 Transcript_58930/m.175287 type:complete len:280 (-) Transcript_58930:150-989(-)|eukprot:CAMPEP_0113555198 /NCGR_PEP_ID=MMETSP0015_2-20120614/16579_1 /TAXON_ID=2838 /ORGANISM="Odontella" /LENGTH=279 /DNA_ID=CAMNT_0000456439 /DNA_START=176 /DNA_END=1015 /DNA_ORIENTATION=- /assembly_acc=CAM_ASM_000160
MVAEATIRDAERHNESAAEYEDEKDRSSSAVWVDVKKEEDAFRNGIDEDRKNIDDDRDRGGWSVSGRNNAANKWFLAAALLVVGAILVSALQSLSALQSSDQGRRRTTTGGLSKLQGLSRQRVEIEGVKFRHAFSRLGKTHMDDEEEPRLLGYRDYPWGKTFLMELERIDFEDPVLADKFLSDAREFLGLEHDLAPLHRHESETEREAATAEHYIDICDDEHILARAELVRTGRDAYMWIQDYFLKSPDVVVSSPERILESIERWQYDPCTEEEEGGRI